MDESQPAVAAPVDWQVRRLVSEGTKGQPMTMIQFRGRCHTCGHDHDRETQHWRDVLELATRADGMPASSNERYLRRLLAARVAMPGTYYDDGEAQGQEHGIVIDFMREPVADIDAKLRALNVARAECA